MVLILVVVDDGLVLHKSNTARHQVERVLILIVVDDGLVQLKVVVQSLQHGLNPYCSGRWSRTSFQALEPSEGAGVLILIVVDDGLVQSNGAEGNLEITKS